MTDEHGGATDDPSRGPEAYHPMMQALGTLTNLAHLITGSGRGPGGEELHQGEGAQDDVSVKRQAEEENFVEEKRRRVVGADDLAAHNGSHMHLHMQQSGDQGGVSEMQQQQQQQQQHLQAYAMHMSGAHDGSGGPTSEELAAAGLSSSGLGLSHSMFGGASHLLPHLSQLGPPGSNPGGPAGPGSAMALLPGLGLGALPPGTSPEALLALHNAQIAALQAHGGAGQLGLSAEMLAAAASGGFAMAGGEHGQFPTLGPDMQPMGLDPATLAAVAGAQGGQMAIPLDFLSLPHLSPELLQSIQAGNLPFNMLPAGYGMAPMGSPTEQQPTADPNMVYKNWWDEEDEKELLRFVGDGEYRRLKLGSEELDWQALEAHFRRSQNALRKKYWMLSKAPMPGTMEATPKQRAERKNWTEEETAELKRLVAAQSGADGESVDWEKLAAHFGTSVQTVKRKHRHAQEHLSLASGTPASTEKGKRQHHRKNVPYRWMIVYALSQLPGLEGTALQIFDVIEGYAPFVDQLDTRIMPGTKHVPRWKIQVRKVLSADNIFRNTGHKQKHETVWQLDPVALQETNAERQRQRAGLPPFQLPTEVAAGLAGQDGGAGGAAAGPSLPQDGGAGAPGALPHIPLDVASLSAGPGAGLGVSAAMMQQVLEATTGQAGAAPQVPQQQQQQHHPHPHQQQAEGPQGGEGATPSQHLGMGMPHSLGLEAGQGGYGARPTHDYDEAARGRG
ncbi:hypothetical protein ACKKBG_A10665 [Auxenochlorella protothecoides x Auxenochlorella symbiontica]